MSRRRGTKELEGKLNSLLEDFAYQLRETVKAIDDKTLAKKIARDSDLRMAELRREFSEQFNSTVVAHTTRADKNDPAAQPHIPKGIKVGDLVKLKSLGRQARVDRVIDAKNFEVSVGPMKMRAAIDDIAEVESVKVVTPLEAARKRGGITVATANDDTDYMTVGDQRHRADCGRGADRGRAIYRPRFSGRAAADSDCAWHRHGGVAADVAGVPAEPSACLHRYRASAESGWPGSYRG